MFDLVVQLVIRRATILASAGIRNSPDEALIQLEDG